MSVLFWLVVGLVAAIALFAVFEMVRVRRMAARRPHMTPESFHDALGVGVDAEVSRAVFVYLQRYMSRRFAFPVQPADDLSIYGIVNGDLEHAVEELLEELGRSLPEPPFPVIETAEDLVCFLDQCPEEA